MTDKAWLMRPRHSMTGAYSPPEQVTGPGRAKGEHGRLNREAHSLEALSGARPYKWSIAPGSLGYRVGRGEDAYHGGEQPEPTRADRGLPVPAQWSAGNKTEAVLRLLRGEPLETLSRELGIEAHRLAAWRDDFLAAARRR
jgi:hypothetical protein